MSDLEHTWKIVLAVGFIAFLLSFISLFVIRYAAGCMVWGMIVLYLALLTTLGVIFLK